MQVPPGVRVRMRRWAAAQLVDVSTHGNAGIRPGCERTDDMFRFRVGHKSVL